MASNRIANRHAVRLPFKSGEHLGQPVVLEMLRCFDDRRKDTARFRVESVTSKPGGDERIIVRPYRTKMVSDRIGLPKRR